MSSELRKFVAPEVVFGLGARHLLVRYAENSGATKLLLVSDPGVEEAGWTGEIARELQEAGFPFVKYTDVSPNPPSRQVMAGAEIFLRERCNAIAVIGGGSPMDCAKGIGIVVAEGKPILEFEGVDKVQSATPPLICVPTTGGSSADVSQFSIITNEATRTKIAIISKALVPDVALIDAETLTTMPTALTVATGMDALTHAFEAYVSNANSPLTDLLAWEAARLLFSYLPLSLQAPDNLDFRAKVMLASMDAGLAFSNASLGAVHAMAHAAGGWLDSPHGDCNSILLPHVVEYNFNSASERYKALGDAAGLRLTKLTNSEACDTLVARIRQFQTSIHAPARFRDYRVERESFGQLAAMAMVDACMATNPRRPTVEEIERIYGKAF